jgi:hypothetical protein
MPLTFVAISAHLDNPVVQADSVNEEVLVSIRTADVELTLHLDSPDAAIALSDAINRAARELAGRTAASRVPVEALPFRKGDRVVCVDDRNSTGLLTDGDEFTVSEIGTASEDNVQLAELAGYPRWWNSDRFVLVEAAK